MHFADLHTHPLPDPAGTGDALAETLRALRRLRASGVTEVALAPTLHRPAPWAGWTLRERVAEAAAFHARVREACVGRDDLPHPHPGARLQALDRGELLALLEHPVGLGGARALLLDFGAAPWGRPEAVIGCARAAGYQVVVAHPERCLARSPEEGLARLRRWHGLGAFLQLELGSLAAPDTVEGGLAWHMVEEGLAHLVASDAHPAFRPALHGEVFAALAARGGEDQAARLLGENPRRLLRGLAALPVRPLSPAPLAAAG